MKKQVFIVTQTWKSLDDYKPSTEVLGVFNNHDDAVKCMNDQIATERKEGYQAWNLEGTQGEGEDEETLRPYSRMPRYLKSPLYDKLFPRLGMRKTEEENDEN